jgi:transformation/transcription domain-associated protein
VVPQVPMFPFYLTSSSRHQQAIYRGFGAATQLFMFKRQFVTQLALTSFIGHVMAVAHRSPGNIYFSRSTANILHLAFTPGMRTPPYPSLCLLQYLCAQSHRKALSSDVEPEFHKTSGLLDWPEPVPFRLTRNLQVFCNPLWMDGPLNGAMTSVARCLAQPQARAPFLLVLALAVNTHLLSTHARRRSTCGDSFCSTCETSLPCGLLTKLSGPPRTWPLPT